MKTIENKNKIVDYITERGEAGSMELAVYIDLSQARVRVLLSELIDDRIIKTEGEGRSRRYVLFEDI